MSRTISAGFSGSRTMRGQWSSFESNSPRQSFKSLQTSPMQSPRRTQTSIPGNHQESWDSLDDRPPTRSSSGKRKSPRGEKGFSQLKSIEYFLFVLFFRGLIYYYCFII